MYIGTLSFCISLSCAPLSVSLIRAFGHRGFRIVGLAGTGVLTISALGSSFIQDPAWLFLTHSIMYGVGSSMIYMASSLVIGDYFQKDHKYHVLATSILLCGYPIGWWWTSHVTSILTMKNIIEGSSTRSDPCDLFHVHIHLGMFILSYGSGLHSSCEPNNRKFAYIRANTGKSKVSVYTFLLNARMVFQSMTWWLWFSIRVRNLSKDATQSDGGKVAPTPHAISVTR